MLTIVGGKAFFLGPHPIARATAASSSMRLMAGVGLGGSPRGPDVPLSVVVDAQEPSRRAK